MSKYSVKSTIETPTMFTVITRHTASFSEFQMNLGILPAKKKRITASGSVCPAAFFAVKICVSVFRHGSSMKPKKRYTKNATPNTFHSMERLSPEAFFFIAAPPYAFGAS